MLISWLYFAYDSLEQYNVQFQEIVKQVCTVYLFGNDI